MYELKGTFEPIKALELLFVGYILLHAGGLHRYRQGKLQKMNEDKWEDLNMSPHLELQDILDQKEVVVYEY